MPILYLLVIGTLLSLQFGGIETRTERVGELELTVSRSKGLGGDERLRSVKLVWGALSLRLSPGSPATLEDGSGITERLRPTVCRVNAGAVTVTLGNKAELAIAADDKRFVLRASPAGSLAVPVELSIPISLDASVRAAAVEGLPLLRIAEPDRTTYVSAPADGQLDERRARATLRTGSATEILTVERRGAEEDPYDYWFSRVPVPGTREEYRAIVAEYLRRCYAAWQSELAAGASGLVSRDALLTAYLAESVARGTLPQAVAFLAPRVALELAQGSRPARALPAALLGMPRAYADGARVRLASVIDEVLRRTASRDVGVFRLPRLAHTVLAAGPPGSLEELVSLASSLPVASGDADALLDVARFYADLESAFPGRAGVRDRLGEILHRRIVPLLARTDSGLYFLPSPASGAALDRTVAAGRLLVDAAGLLGRPELEGAGRRCILSALSLAGPEGRLPARVRMDGGRLVTAADEILPESVYELVAEERYLPLERALVREGDEGRGAGMWMLSAARITALELGSDELRLELAFPVGLTHYLVVEGIPSIAQVRLHGLAWRPDAQFEWYSDGWWLAAQSRTLALKITQQREVEEIVLSFP